MAGTRIKEGMSRAETIAAIGERWPRTLILLAEWCRDDPREAFRGMIALDARHLYGHRADLAFDPVCNGDVAVFRQRVLRDPDGLAADLREIGVTL